MKSPKFLTEYGPWALVTGASSGLGEEFCRQLAIQKINLVMVARRKDRLEKISRELEDRYSIETKVIAADISKADFLQQITNITDSMDIGLLINNAGFALTGNFLDHSLEEELSLLYVNCRAPLMLAHTFGKKMVQRGGGGIINVSSVSGFMPLPFWTHYAATKAYSLNLSEGLWFELKGKEVDVLALCPGGTNTEFSQVAGTKHGGMKPSSVVALALRDLGRKPTTIVGIGNRMIVLLGKIMPRPWMIKMGARAVKGMINQNGIIPLTNHGM